MPSPRDVNRPAPCGPDFDEQVVISYAVGGLAAGVIRMAVVDAADTGDTPAVPHVEAMERLVHVVQELSLARDLETIMTIVRRAARRLTGADGATFILRDGDQCHYADEDAIAPLWKGRRFPMSACISGWAMLHREPAVIEDIYVDPRIPREAYQPTFVKSLVMVPIRTLEPIGAIGNYWARTRQPSEQEVRLLQALADTTAVAMENVQVYAELEQRIRDRTEELQAANKDLESFSYSVSHDLRAPIRAITGFARLLQEDHEDQLDEEARRKLSIIRDEADRMGILIDDLLSFSRLGRKAIDAEALDMSALVGSLVERLRADAGNGSAAFRVAPLPDSMADRALMEQVWINLLSNAVKFSSGREQPVIEIGGKPEAAENVYFVHDNGAGFDPRYQDKLFAVFQRLHDATEFPGTGVGLAIVHRIIARHGGRVWAEGRPGDGATFYFTLPRQRQDEFPGTAGVTAVNDRS